MGATHLDAIDVAPSADVVAVVDPIADALEPASRRGLACYLSVEEALGVGQFDAAVVSAPSDLHLGLLRSLMAARIPTLCEKPCGLASSETKEAAQLAADADTVLQIGYWRRFVPQLRDLRRRIHAGELGELALIQAWQWDGEPPAAGFRIRSGGIVRDMGVHEFDQIRWLTGQEVVVTGVAESAVTSVAPVANDPESVAVMGTLSGGGVALVSLGRRYAHGDSCWLEVIGTNDTARCEFMCGDDGDRVFRKALVDQVEAFVSAVRGSDGDGATAADAVAALAAAEQAGRIRTH